MTESLTSTKPEKKLSRIKPGHWRNEYETLKAMRLFNPDAATITTMIPGQKYFGYGRYQSEEAAREVAAGCALNPDSDQGSGDARYLGPVFFPDPP